MEWIVITILSILLVVCFFFLFKQKRQLKTTLDKYLIQKTKNAEEKINNQYRERIDEIKKIEAELIIKKTQLDETTKHINLQNEIFENLIKSRQEIIDKQIEQYKENCQQNVDLWIKEYQESLKKDFEDKVEIINLSISALKNEEESVKAELEDFRKRREVVNQEILRQREVLEQSDFYRIVLTDMDIEDIKVLTDISPRMKRRDIIPKLIWDAIVSRPTNEMIKRVWQKRTKEENDRINKLIDSPEEMNRIKTFPAGGIYKVQYIPTGEIYIGKTTDFSTRWKNHVQTALGMEKAASSTFHTHMMRNGVWNYTFEILEFVVKEEQTQREKYWIEFYESNKYGLNQKVG